MMLGTNTDIKKITENWIPENSLGAEIGIWRGDTSKQLLTKCSYLHMIDPYNISVYENTTDWLNIGYEKILKRYSSLVGSLDPADFQKFYDDLYLDVCEQFKDLPATIHRMTSRDWFSSYTGEKLDWIYIDGDHSYEGVMEDLVSSLDVVKQNGLIFLDDYSIHNRQHPGVRAAVRDFCYERKLKFMRLYINTCMIKLRA
jgi:hypothetical protein